MSDSLIKFAGYLVDAKKDADGALKIYQKSLEILTQLAEKDANNISYQKEITKIYLNFAYLNYYREDFKSALTNAQKAQEIIVRLQNQDPQNEEIQRFAAQTDRWNSKILIKLGRGAEVIPHLESLLEKLENQYKASPSDKLVYFEIGEVRYQLGYAYKTLAAKTGNSSDKKRSCEYFHTTYKMYQEFLESGFSGAGAFNQEELGLLSNEVKNCGQ